MIFALERHGAFWTASVRETMEGGAVINGMSSDNTGIAGNGKSSKSKVACDLSNT
jgi:hypothetical protein